MLKCLILLFVIAVVHGKITRERKPDGVVKTRIGPHRGHIIHGHYPRFYPSWSLPSMPSLTNMFKDDEEEILERVTSLEKTQLQILEMLKKITDGEGLKVEVTNFGKKLASTKTRNPGDLCGRVTDERMRLYGIKNNFGFPGFESINKYISHISSKSDLSDVSEADTKSRKNDVKVESSAPKMGGQNSESFPEKSKVFQSAEKIIGKNTDVEVTKDERTFFDHIDSKINTETISDTDIEISTRKMDNENPESIETVPRKSEIIESQVKVSRDVEKVSDGSDSKKNILAISDNAKDESDEFVSETVDAIVASSSKNEKDKANDSDSSRALDVEDSDLVSLGETSTNFPAIETTPNTISIEGNKDTTISGDSPLFTVGHLSFNRTILPNANNYSNAVSTSGPEANVTEVSSQNELLVKNYTSKNDINVDGDSSPEDYGTNTDTKYLFGNIEHLSPQEYVKRLGNRINRYREMQKEIMKDIAKVHEMMESEDSNTNFTSVNDMLFEKIDSMVQETKVELSKGANKTKPFGILDLLSLLDRPILLHPLVQTSTNHIVSHPSVQVSTNHILSHPLVQASTNHILSHPLVQASTSQILSNPLVATANQVFGLGLKNGNQTTVAKKPETNSTIVVQITNTVQEDVPQEGTEQIEDNEKKNRNENEKNSKGTNKKFEDTKTPVIENVVEKTDNKQDQTPDAKTVSISDIIISPEIDSNAAETKSPVVEDRSNSETPINETVDV